VVAIGAGCPKAETKTDANGQEIIQCIDGSWVPLGTECMPATNWAPIMIAALVGLGIAGAMGGVYMLKKTKNV
jgi:hypothetical protein